MKLLLLIGGILGFAIGLLFGLAQQSAWPDVLWRASLAAYVAGLLMRWWGRVWVRNLEAAQRERQAKLEPPAEALTNSTEANL